MKNKKISKGLEPVASVLWDKNIRAEPSHLSDVVVCNTAATGICSEDLERPDSQREINATYEMFEDIKPSDSIEAMLLSQMVGMYNLSMKQLRDARMHDLTLDQVTQKVNRATKLSKTFVELLEAFNHCRGKGQQKVTVEHVTVNQGGQAIVGTIEKK